MKRTFVPVKFLTVRQAARALGSVPGSIYSRISHRSLPSVVIDGRVMVPVSDVYHEMNKAMLAQLAEMRAAGAILDDPSPP